LVIEDFLLLAFRAVVAASSHDDHPLHRRLTDQARFSFAAIDSVLQLEKPFFPVGIDVVRD
jgi:hypothetical protein